MEELFTSHITTGVGVVVGVFVGVDVRDGVEVCVDVRVGTGVSVGDGVSVGGDKISGGVQPVRAADAAATEATCKKSRRVNFTLLLFLLTAKTWGVSNESFSESDCVHRAL